MNSIKSPSRLAAVLLASVMLAITLLPARTDAQTTTAPAPADEPQVWRLSVAPAPITRPALEHGLLYKPADQIPGNAAPLYLMAMAEARKIEVPLVDPAALKAKGLPPTDEPDMMSYFIALPLKQIPVAELDAFLKPYASAFTLLDSACRQDRCDWAIPLRDTGFDTLLPYLNDARHLTNMASLRVRLHAARGEHDAAVRGARAIFQLGHDVAAGGLMIQGLVGTGLAAVGAERLRDIVQQPGSPNLYWPLANVPRPFVSLRETMEWEALGLRATYPPLQKVAEGKPFTAADWEELVKQQGRINRIMATHGGEGGGVSLDSPLGPAGAGAVLYPQAKEYLLARGMTPEQVEALPVPEALGRYVYGEYRAAFEEFAKWAALPYWQAQPAMAAANRQLFGESASLPVRAFAAGLPKSAARAATTFARHDTRMAALQTVEAVRAYAASHNGELPATLDALVEAGTPAPVNPFTGEAPGYRIDGARAVIEFPALSAESKRQGLRVELTIVK